MYDGSLSDEDLKYHMGRVAKMVSLFKRRYGDWIEYDDFYQVGCEALLSCVGKNHHKLWTFARHRVAGALVDELRRLHHTKGGRPKLAHFVCIDFALDPNDVGPDNALSQFNEEVGERIGIFDTCEEDLDMAVLRKAIDRVMDGCDRFRRDVLYTKLNDRSARALADGYGCTEALVSKRYAELVEQIKGTMAEW